jgi:hypothetical protein
LELPNFVYFFRFVSSFFQKEKFDHNIQCDVLTIRGCVILIVCLFHC